MVRETTTSMIESALRLCGLKNILPGYFAERIR